MHACAHKRSATPQAGHAVSPTAVSMRWAARGWQTAEMPGFYSPGEYDVAGFAVGAVRQEALVDGRSIAQGDALLGFASSGVHSNGFSLVRKILEARALQSPFLCPTIARDAEGSWRRARSSIC